MPASPAYEAFLQAAVELLLPILDQPDGTRMGTIYIFNLKFPFLKSTNIL